jgi:hypothetical protein
VSHLTCSSYVVYRACIREIYQWKLQGRRGSAEHSLGITGTGHIVPGNLSQEWRTDHKPVFIAMSAFISSSWRVLFCSGCDNHAEIFSLVVLFLFLSAMLLFQVPNVITERIVFTLFHVAPYNVAPREHGNEKWKSWNLYCTPAAHTPSAHLRSPTYTAVSTLCLFLYTLTCAAQYRRAHAWLAERHECYRPKWRSHYVLIV